MNIYKYLELDHDHVAKLFKQFDESELIARKKQIVALIAQELLVHAHAEQETFYKALQQFELTKDKAMHGKKEHQEIEAQISLILHSKEFNAAWIKKVDKLKEIVEHHVEEEEGKIFEKAQQVLSEEDAYILKEQMHYLKQKFLLSLEKEAAKNTLKKQITPKNSEATKKVSPQLSTKKMEPRSRPH